MLCSSLVWVCASWYTSYFMANHFISGCSPSYWPTLYVDRRIDGASFGPRWSPISCFARNQTEPRHHYTRIKYSRIFKFVIFNWVMQSCSHLEKLSAELLVRVHSLSPLFISDFRIPCIDTIDHTGTLDRCSTIQGYIAVHWLPRAVIVRSYVMCDFFST